MERGGSQRPNVHTLILYPHLCRSSLQDDLLEYHSTKRGEFDIGHLGHLPYLPADLVQFRQDDTKRSLWRSCEFHAVYRNLEFDMRLHHRGITNANALGAPNADEKENWPQHRFGNGSHVSISSANRVDPNPNLFCASICALTLTRVICSIYYEPNNYTISAALTALITGLEPIAGVINACLPFMPLVFKRLGQTHIFSRLSATFKSFTMGSSEEYSTAASGSKERRKHSAPFQGLSDVEMKPVNDSGFATSYISIGSHNSILESGTWDGNRGGQDRVFVRNDFCIESEPC